MDISASFAMISLFKEVNCASYNLRSAEQILFKKWQDREALGSGVSLMILICSLICQDVHYSRLLAIHTNEILKVAILWEFVDRFLSPKSTLSLSDTLRYFSRSHNYLHASFIKICRPPKINGKLSRFESHFKGSKATSTQFYGFHVDMRSSE